MTNIVPFLSYVFVVTFTPGPNNIMSLVNANKHGYKKTVKFTLGVFSGFIIIMLMSSYFNLILFNIMPKVKIFMGIIGAMYMTYLAIKIIKSKDSEEKKGSKNLNSYITGLTMQFVNPKVILYGITVMSNFIIPYYKSNLALIIISVLLAFVALLSTTCWALFGALFQKLLLKYRKPFNIAFGLLLIYSAVSISGIMDLLN